MASARSVATFVACTISLAGCGGGAARTDAAAFVPVAPAAHASPGVRAATANPIKHIVIVLQENRSFDNVFHHFAMPDGTKADTADGGFKHDGTHSSRSRRTRNTASSSRRRTSPAAC